MAGDLDAELQRVNARLIESTLKNCAQLAGLHFDAMLRGFEDTREYLNSADARLRLAALQMIEIYWERMGEVSQVCERLAFKDSDLEVRRRALSALGECHLASYDFKIGKQLAEMIHDETQPSILRTAAYGTLYRIRDLLFLNMSSFHFPDDIDWAFVNSFLEEREPPSEVERMRDQFPFFEEETCRALISWEKAQDAFKSGEVQDAVVHLTECIDMLEGAGAYLRRAEAYLLLAQWDEAIGDFTKSLEIQPGSAKAHLGRG